MTEQVPEILPATEKTGDQRIGGVEGSESSVRSSTTYVLLCCCVASFSDVFMYAVLPPIIPFALPEVAHVPRTQVQQWAAVLPAVTAGATVLASPVAGWMGDNTSRRKPLFVGAVFLQWTGISLIMAGRHIALWITALIVYGIGSAVVWSTSLALIIDRVPREQLARFLSFTSLSLCLAVFVGPILGGIIFERAGHYAVWGVVLAVSVVDLVLRLFLIESSRITPTTENSKPAHALPVLRLFRSPRLVCALFGAFVQATILTSFDASLTIHASRTFGWKSTAAGLLYLAFCAPSFASPLVGMLADRFGAKGVATIAFLSATPTLVCLRFVQENTLRDKVLLAALLVLLGSFLSTTIAVFSAEVSHVVHEMAERRPGIWGDKGILAQGEALWWASYTLGLAVGPLWGGFVQQSAGWITLSWSLALLSGVTSMPVVAFAGSRPGPPSAKGDNSDRI